MLWTCEGTCSFLVEGRRFVLVSPCWFQAVSSLFVLRQMEVGSLVSHREDISSLFPQQIPGAKYKVGGLLYCRGHICTFVDIHPHSLSFVRIWAASSPLWGKYVVMETASTGPSASLTWSQSCTTAELCRGQWSSVLTSARNKLVLMKCYIIHVSNNGFDFRFKDKIIRSSEVLSSAGFVESRFKQHLNTVNNSQLSNNVVIW